jgi:hypothetical protein
MPDQRSPNPAVPHSNNPETKTVTPPGPGRPNKKRTLPRVLLTGTLVFVLCVLLIGGIVWVVSKLVTTGSEWFRKANQQVEKQQKDQKRLEQERNERQQQLEGALTGWKAPPEDAGQALLLPPIVGDFTLVENDDKADVSELNLARAGQRALYRGPDSTVELLVYRATKGQKASILRAAIDAVTRPGGLLLNNPAIPGSPSVLGTAEGTCVTYDLGAQAATARKHGAFVWQDDWLLLARGSSGKDPAAFLKVYLAGKR